MTPGLVITPRDVSDASETLRPLSIRRPYAPQYKIVLKKIG
jgi:hypothetical protein